MRGDQNRESRRGGPRRTGERRGGRFNDTRRKGSRDERPRRFRKGSKDFAKRSERDN